MMVHQVLAPHDKGIIDEVNKIASAADIKFEGNKELIQVIGEDTIVSIWIRCILFLLILK